MDTVLRFAALGAVLILSMESEAGIFNDILDLATKKKHMQVGDWHLESCGSGNDGLELHNIQVSNSKRKEEIVVSGIVNVKTFLSAPVSAKVSMERQVLGIWVKVPCIQDFGSCTYEDLCNYGYAEDTTCPASFAQDHVPCRCPIKQGLYNIPSDVRIHEPGTRWWRVVKGKYRATVHFLHRNSDIACYITSFTLKAVPK